MSPAVAHRAAKGEPASSCVGVPLAMEDWIVPNLLFPPSAPLPRVPQAARSPLVITDAFPLPSASAWPRALTQGTTLPTAPPGEL